MPYRFQLSRKPSQHANHTHRPTNKKLPIARYGAMGSQPVMQKRELPPLRRQFFDVHPGAFFPAFQAFFGQLDAFRAFA